MAEMTDAEQFLARCREAHGLTEEQAKDWTCETDEDGTITVRTGSGGCVGMLVNGNYFGQNARHDFSIASYVKIPPTPEHLLRQLLSLFDITSGRHIEWCRRDVTISQLKGDEFEKALHPYLSDEQRSQLLGKWADS